MNKAWLASALSALLAFIGGCAAEPITRAPLPLLNNPNPVDVRASFLHEMPNLRVTFDETVIIRAPFHKELAVLAELVVDRPADRFELVGLTHVGVTLFKISGDVHGASVDFAVPQLLEHKNLLLALGLDIRRIYFDLVPNDAASVTLGKTLIRFSEKTSEGRLVYEFGGEPALLLEKHLDGFFGAIWRVEYFQYESSGEGLFPREIVMNNNQFHYQIIVKNRAIR